MPSGNDNRDRVRDVRVPDDLWKAAQEAAEWRAENVSLVVRRALRQYVAGTRRQQQNGRQTRASDRFLPAPSSRGGRIRHVRVSDELWEATQAAVSWRGDASASHIIRRALAQYVVGTDKRRREAPGG